MKLGVSGVPVLGKGTPDFLLELVPDAGQFLSGFL
jgi:hypothetical protein